MARPHEYVCKVELTEESIEHLDRLSAALRIAGEGITRLTELAGTDPDLSAWVRKDLIPAMNNALDDGARLRVRVADG